jgi:hypothetical protein
VKNHCRKYGDKDSHPIPLWNGVFEHYKRIGDALWEFLWCIDAITKEKDGVGLVLGGSPVKLERIVADLKGDKESVRRHLKRLAAENYLRMRRTPYGQVIEVLNSKKFGIWRKEKPQNAVSLSREKPIHESEKPIHEREKPQNAVSKEDSAGTQHKDTAVRAACPVWAKTEVDPQRLPGAFRKLCEDRWSVRNGSSLFDFMGDVLDAWQVLEGPRCKYPPAWVRRKVEVGQSAPKREANLPELEAIPWNK